MSEEDVVRHVDAANATWIARSALAWTLDLSMLTDAGVTLARPEKASGRPAVAERALGQAREPEAVPEQRTATNTISAAPARQDQAPSPRRWLRRLGGR